MGIKHAFWFIILAQTAVIASGAWSVKEAVWGAAALPEEHRAPVASVACEFDSRGTIEPCPRGINAQNDGAKTYVIMARATPLSLGGAHGGERQARDAGFVWVHNICGTEMRSAGRCIDNTSASRVDVDYRGLLYSKRQIEISPVTETKCEMHVAAIRSILNSGWHESSARCGV